MLDFTYDAVCIVLLEVLSIDLKFHIVIVPDMGNVMMGPDFK